MRRHYYTATGLLCATLLSACVHEDQLPPAIPAPRMPWGNSLFIPITPPPPELAWQPPTPLVALQLDGFVRVAPPLASKAQRHGPRPLRAALPTPPLGQETGPTRQLTLQPHALYTVPISPGQPTYLLLPAGERLASPPAIDTEQYVVGLTEIGQGDQRIETVVVRPMQAGISTTTGLLFKSGLVFFVKLLSSERPGWLSVSFALPPKVSQRQEIPLAERPPVINLGRIYERYAITPEGKTSPPWLPSRVLDDGTRTFIVFHEALTYTRAPQVFGRQTNQSLALVQSHMFLHPDPARGAVLVVQGLWPALDLVDGAKMRVKIVRQAVQ